MVGVASATITAKIDGVLEWFAVVQVQLNHEGSYPCNSRLDFSPRSVS